MRFVSRCVPVVALVLGLGAARADAQTAAAQRPDNFAFYIGGYGGVLNFNASAQTRATVPLGGAQLMIKAKRTGLILQVDQGFGSDERAIFQTQLDSAGTRVSPVTTDSVSFDWVRKYSAILVAFPIRAPISPYFGIGVGLMEVGGYNRTTTEGERQLGTSGFGTIIGGIQIQYSRVTAFGQYQVTTGRSQDAVETQDLGGPFTQLYRTPFLRGVTHSLTAGLRFNLGRSKESFSGSY